MENIKRLVGERIRDLRKEKGLSQEGLGWKSELHYTYIGAIERGEKNWSIDTLAKVAKGLGVHLNALLCTPISEKVPTKSKSAFITEIKKYTPEVLKNITDLVTVLEKR